MPRAWLISPVIGTGAEDDPFRPAVFDREGTEGDRLEAVIDAEKSSTCLVGYDVADDSDMAVLGGEKLLVEADLDKAVDRVAEADKLDALAREAKVGRSGSAREVLRRIGQTIDPSFDERLHLGSGVAPPTGSFGVDTFTDEDGTKSTEHTPDTGEGWTLVSGEDPVIIANRLRQAKETGASLGILTFDTLAAGPDYDLALDCYFAATSNLNAATVGGYNNDEAGGNRYQYSRVHFAGVANYVNLARVKEGKSTELGKYAIGFGESEPEVGQTDALILSLREGAQAGYLNGEEVISTTDSAIEATGEALITVGSTLSQSNIHLDNFTATDAGGEEEAQEVALEPLTETDALLDAAVSSKVTLAALTDTSAFQSLSTRKLAALSPLADTAALQPLSTRKRATLAALTDSSAMQAVAIVKRPQLEALIETDTMQALIASELVALVPLSETDTMVAVNLLTVLLAAHLALRDRAVTALAVSDAATTDLAVSSRAKTNLVLKDGPPQ